NPIMDPRGPKGNERRRRPPLAPLAPHQQALAARCCAYAGAPMSRLRSASSPESQGAVRISPARHAPRQERVASVGPLINLARYPAVWLARNLTVQVKDKLINFNAGRPGCGHLRESLLSRLIRAFCLKAERASALYNVGIHWSPVGFHWPSCVVGSVYFGERLLRVPIGAPSPSRISLCLS